MNTKTIMMTANKPAILPHLERLDFFAPPVFEFI